MESAAGDLPAAATPAATPPTPATRATTTPQASQGTAEIPSAMQDCADCHLTTVQAYLEHAMSGSLSPVRTIEYGTVDNPITGKQYQISEDDDRLLLEVMLPSGGQRRQRLVGQIGAGRFDISYAAEELDPETGLGTGRLFFAPVELVTGHGLELAPFDLYPSSPSVDMALTDSCLTCHTLDPLHQLPDAATAEQNQRALFPPHALGSDAFEQLSSLTCNACHGSTDRHVAIMRGEAAADITDLGLAQLAALPAGEQLDRCARCHLQGEARFELFVDHPDPTRPLAGQLPTLITGSATSDDYRFVGQLERLALSACFRGSPEMTCTTCHDAHGSVREQGTTSFDASCQACHNSGHENEPSDCSRSPELAVKAVTGDEARTEAGCVDCHVRRSQPFDLPHVRTADHFVRRSIPLPKNNLPHRQFTDARGPLKLYDDGRLAAQLRTDGGARWLAGIEAMGLLTAGRVEEAIGRFDRFPPAGSDEARRPSTSGDLIPLETQTSFHQMRALALLGSGRLDEAIAAYGDALTIDPYNSGARLERARVLLDRGEGAGVLLETESVIQTHPKAEAPWLLRADLAQRAGRNQLALEALEKAVERWPSNGLTWQSLAQVRAQFGDVAGAEQAARRASELGATLP